MIHSLSNRFSLFVTDQTNSVSEYVTPQRLEERNVNLATISMDPLSMAQLEQPTLLLMPMQTLCMAISKPITRPITLLLQSPRDLEPLF